MTRKAGRGPIFDLENLFKGLSKLSVKDGVYERVDNGIDVAQPSGDEEDVHAWSDFRYFPFDGYCI